MLKKEFVLDEYKKSLISKFGYDEFLAEDIALMAESLITYFGEEYESVVMDALLSCKMFVLNLRKNSTIIEKVPDVLERENMIEDFDYEEIKNLDFGYFKAPRIEYVGGDYKITSVKKVIVLPSYFNSDSPNSIAVLARVCIKLIKSELNPYVISGNKLVIREGVAETTQKLQKLDGKVTRKVISRKGYGFKNGLDCYDQFCLVKKIYNSDYDVYGAYNERIFGGYLLDGENFNLKSEIRKAEMLHDDEPLKDMFRDELGASYEKFLSITDKVTDFDKEIRNSLEEENRIRATEDLEVYYREDVAGYMRSFEEAMKMSKTL